MSCLLVDKNTGQNDDSTKILHLKKFLVLPFSISSFYCCNYHDDASNSNNCCCSHCHNCITFNDYSSGNTIMIIFISVEVYDYVKMMIMYYCYYDYLMTIIITGIEKLRSLDLQKRFLSSSKKCARTYKTGGICLVHMLLEINIG